MCCLFVTDRYLMMWHLSWLSGVAPLHLCMTDSLMLFHISVHDQHVHNDVAAFCLWLTCPSQCGTFLYISWFSYTWWYGFFWSVCGCQVLLLFHLFATNTECHFMFLWSAHHILSSVVTFCLSFADQKLDSVSLTQIHNNVSVSLIHTAVRVEDTDVCIMDIYFLFSAMFA